LRHHRAAAGLFRQGHKDVVRLYRTSGHGEVLQGREDVADHTHHHAAEARARRKPLVARNLYNAFPPANRSVEPADGPCVSRYPVAWLPTCAQAG
jgi:hypothetical protein